MKMVREEIGFTNVKLMLPFVRTVKEATSVIDIMRENGLVRGENKLQLYMMVEIPSNALLAEEFAKRGVVSVPLGHFRVKLTVAIVRRKEGGD